MSRLVIVVNNSNIDMTFSAVAVCATSTTGLARRARSRTADLNAIVAREVAAGRAEHR